MKSSRSSASVPLKKKPGASSPSPHPKEDAFGFHHINYNEFKNVFATCKNSTGINWVLKLRQTEGANRPMARTAQCPFSVCEKTTESSVQRKKIFEHQIDQINTLNELINSKSRQYPNNLANFNFETGMRTINRPKIPFRTSFRIKNSSAYPTMPQTKQFAQKFDTIKPFEKGNLVVLNDGRRNFPVYSSIEKENKFNLRNMVELDTMYETTTHLPTIAWTSSLRRTKPNTAPKPQVSA